MIPSTQVMIIPSFIYLLISPFLGPEVLHYSSVITIITIVVWILENKSSKIEKNEFE